MQPDSVKTRKAWLLAGLKIAVSAGLLVVLAWNLDMPAVRAAMARLPADAALFAVLLLAAQTLVLGLRWWLVLGVIGTPFGYGRIVQLMFTGVFFNQVLPTSFGGDAVRMWQVSRLGVRYDAAIIGVLLERASGVVGLVVMVALGTWYLGDEIGNAALRYSLVAMLPLALLGVAVLASLDRLPERWRRWRLLRDMGRLAADARRIFLAPGIALLLLLLSILSHALAALAVYAIADGIGAGLSVWYALALFPPVILITLIPVSFAGWGLREGASVTMFAFAGMNPDTALAISLTFGLALLAASLPGAVFWLAWRGTSPAGRAP